jgi:hypothetical protein
MEGIWNSQIAIFASIQIKRSVPDPHRFVQPTLRRTMYKVSVYGMGDIADEFGGWKNKQAQNGNRSQEDRLHALLQNL